MSADLLPCPFCGQLPLLGEMAATCTCRVTPDERVPPPDRAADLATLARQITTLPGWKWLPGMRYLLPSGRGLHLQAPGLPGVSGDPPEGSVPDLADPATAGSMLSLIQTDGAMVSLSCEGGRWGMMIVLEPFTLIGDSEGATPGEAIARLAVAHGGWL